MDWVRADGHGQQDARLNSGSVLSMVIGSAITWLAAWWYYRRAGAELRQEAAKLHRLTTIVLNALESASQLGIELTRDASGEIVALSIRGSIGLTVPAPVVRAVGHVGPPPSDPRTTK
jgi:hypothetical protein